MKEKLKMPSSNGFDIDFEFLDSVNKAEEIVIEISEENFYFKERNCTYKSAIQTVYSKIEDIKNW